MPRGSRLSFDIDFVHPPNIWLLQLGGWIPLAFAGVRSILVDRNVIATLSALARHPSRTDMEADKWWLAHLNHQQFILNPVLCALEGRSQRTPTFEEFSEDIKTTCSVLAQGLPNARLLAHDPASFRQLYSLVRDFSERRAREVAFALAVAPLITDRVPKKVISQVEERILREAHKAGVYSRSLAVFCAASCLYERSDGSQPRIGRGVLKLKKSYSYEKAYNAVADLQYLEFLASALAFPGSSFGLVTRDKYLAALWCALGVSQPRLDGKGGLSFNISPSLELFPSLDEEAVAGLVHRLQSRDASVEPGTVGA